MSIDPVSLAAGETAAYQAQRSAYLDRLAAPMDDMWLAFADGAAHHGLYVGDERVGACAVDDEARLLRFHVSSVHQLRSAELLELVIGELGVRWLMVSSVDPHFLSVSLDRIPRVVPHTLFFRHRVAPLDPALAPLRWGEPGDQERIVDFQERELGAPRAFLESYVRSRLERDELVLVEEARQIRALGELRRDDQQVGIAHLGLVVRSAERGRGIGRRLLSALVARTQEEGLRSYCSTEVGNHGARRAIERAGFRAEHRLFALEVRGSTPGT